METRRPAEKVVETLILGAVCLAPWAFGAVEAWTELFLYLAVALAAAVMTVFSTGSPALGVLASVPNLALAGLLLFALGQSVPLSENVFRALDPAEAVVRSEMTPVEPERVIGEDRTPTALPPTTLSHNRDVTLVAAARLAAAWVLFQVVLTLRDPRGFLRRFGLALTLNGCLLAFFALVQWLSWNGKLYWVRPAPRPEEPWFSAGPFISHNSFAAYLNLALGFALVRLLGDGKVSARFRDAGGKFWPAYAVAILLVGLVASHSRGGVLAALGALVVVPLGLRGRVIKSGTALVAVLTMVALIFLATGSLSPFERLATLQEAGGDVRWEVWRYSINAWRQRPVWGAGLGCFATAVLPFTGRTNNFFFAYGESEYVNMLVEGGLIGIGLALTLLVSSGRLGYRGLMGSRSAADRAVVTGAMFGAIALVLHWFSDFSLHVPAIGLTAVVLFATLCRIGLDAVAEEKPTAVSGEARSPRRWPARLAGLTFTSVAALALTHGYRMARAEVALYRSGVPTPGAVLPTLTLWDLPAPSLEKMRDGLERAVRIRPDLAEAHLRLGVVCLSQYRAAVLELVGSDAGPEQKQMADPLWLHAVVHGTPREQLEAAGGVLAHEPVRKYLVPAARSFLEARRCCLILGAAHAELAGLDYLLLGGDSTSVYGRRALLTAGADVQTLSLAAQAGVQSRDLGLAATCWRKELRVNPRGWENVADRAKAALTPDQILAEVVPDAATTLEFAGRLFPEEAEGGLRGKFADHALSLLKKETGLNEAGRQRHTAEAYRAKGERENALKAMESAVALEPMDTGLRRELAAWLLSWGDLKQAKRQALIGLQISPSDPTLGALRDGADAALARGVAASP